MLIWDDAQSLCQSFGNDDSADSLAIFKQLMNLGYKDILHTFTGEETEDVRTTTTEANKRAIKLPPNYARIHTVTATTGTQEYPLTSERSQTKWVERLYANRTSNRPTHYYVRPRMGVGGAELLLDPIPSDAQTVIRIYYGATARDLSVDKYTAGTVAVANDSPTVTGTGTAFSQAMEDRYFRINDADGDGMWYRIVDYTNGTTLKLENDYQSYNISGKAYEIAEAFNLPEDLQMGPVFYAMWLFYFGVRKDRKEAKDWQDQYLLVRNLAEANYKRKDKSNNIDGNGPSSIFPVYPGHFPDGVTGS